MQTAKRVAVNTGILYARMGITIFISLYSTRLILTALGAEDFGLFNIIGGAIAMLGFLNASMAGASQRFMSYEQGTGKTHRLNQIFNVSIILHIIIAALLLVLLEISGYYFFNGVLNIPKEKVEVAKLIYQSMVISTLFTVISVPYDAVINSHENMLFFALIGVIETIAKLIIAIYINNIVEDKLIQYGYLMAILSIILLVIRWIYCTRNYIECKIDLISKFDKRLMVEMTNFAGWSLLGSSTSMLSNYGQGIVLNIFFGTVVNAAQGITNQVSGQLGSFAGVMLKALNPLIAKSEGAGNRHLMLEASMIGSKISFLLLMLMFVPMIIEMPFVLKVWLRNVPAYTIVFCRMYLIKNLIDQLFVTIGATIAAVGNIKKYQVCSSILNFFPLIVTYILFEEGFPPYALYIVFIINSIFISLNILYSAKRTCGLSILAYFNKVVVRCVFTFLVSIMLSICPVFLMHEGFFRLITVIGISIIAFVITVWNLSLTKQEKQQIRSIITVVKSKVFSKNTSLV